MGKKEAKTEKENIEQTAAPQEAEQPSEENTELNTALEAVKKLEDELKAQKDSYLRLAAEYENFRRRTQSEKLAIYDDATSRAVTELLPVADSLDMANKNMQDVPEQYSKGLSMIQNQLTDCLKKLSVEAFCEEGDDFDPSIHNAISKIESEDLGENKISQVFQKGYKINGKIIRHALVQVANCD